MSLYLLKEIWDNIAQNCLWTSFLGSSTANAKVEEKPELLKTKVEKKSELRKAKADLDNMVKMFQSFMGNTSSFEGYCLFS